MGYPLAYLCNRHEHLAYLCWDIFNNHLLLVKIYCKNNSNLQAVLPMLAETLHAGQGEVGPGFGLLAGDRLPVILSVKRAAVGVWVYNSYGSAKD
ncbi:hypothetical protein HRbin15_01701 [bacterium HR15]|nr:hypothetical protein HRbin15_01701 [bacterium HR15]